MAEKHASVHWDGAGKSGTGKISTETGALKDYPYGFASRFGDDRRGTNPEEILGAAHAGCFTMALSLFLTTAGHPPTSLDTQATVHLNKVGDNFAITGIDLELRGVVPGLTAAEFQQHAETAKTGCIVSRALNVPMTLKATLG